MILPRTSLEHLVRLNFHPAFSAPRVSVILDSPWNMQTIVRSSERGTGGRGFCAIMADQRSDVRKLEVPVNGVSMQLSVDPRHHLRDWDQTERKRILRAPVPLHLMATDNSTRTVLLD